MDLTMVYLLSFALLLLVAGYVLPFVANKMIARSMAWSMAIVTVFFSVWITADQSALYRMIAIVTLQLLSMKSLVIVETYQGRNLTFLQWCAFALGWFGMRPTLFEKLPSPSLPYADLVLRGFSRIFIGVLLLFASLYIEQHTPHVYFLSELMLLVGLSMILHFGILNLSTAQWRMLGVDVRELFRAPYKSKSLKEFWGKRWNMAFSEMTAIIAYKPLKNKLGPRWAMVASFLLSGLLHEIAISFPVKSGYGLPMLYFTIHGALMYLEESSDFVKKITSHKIISHLWVMAWLIVPMPLLFHSNFIAFVLKPLRDVITGLFNF